MQRSCVWGFVVKDDKTFPAGQFPQPRVAEPNQVPRLGNPIKLGNQTRCLKANWLHMLTLSGLPLIPVTSFTGMLKNEVNFLSWLIVIWMPS